MSDKLLTIKQAAKELGVSTKTIRRWESQGKITSVRTSGGHRRFSMGKVSPHKAITIKKILPYIVITALLSGGITFFLSKSHYENKTQTINNQLNSYINQSDKKEGNTIDNDKNTTIVDSGVSVIKSEDHGNLLVNSTLVTDQSLVNASSINQEELLVSQVISGIGFIVSSTEDIVTPIYFNWEVRN